MRIIRMIKFPAVTMLVVILAIFALPSWVVSGESAVVDLVLSPAAQIVKAGDTFAVTIQAQCHGQEMMGTDAFLDFDPNYLEVQSVTGGDTLSFPLQNTYDNSIGSIGYSAGKMSPPFPTSTFTVATVTFKARKIDTNIATNIDFHLSDPRITKAVYGDTSILRNTTGTQVVIQGSAPSSPTLTPTPAPAATSTNTPPASPTPTGKSAPLVFTQDILFLKMGEATLKGALADLGGATQVQVSFEWGTDANYGNATPVQTLTDPAEFSYTLTGLNTNTTYHYRIKAVGESTVYSQDYNFTTPSMVFNNSPAGTSSVPTAGTPGATIPASSAAPTGSSSPAGNTLIPSASQNPSPKPSSGSWIIWAAAGIVVIAVVALVIIYSKRAKGR